MRSSLSWLALAHLHALLPSRHSYTARRKLLAIMSASMSASSSSLHGDPSDDPSHNPFMSEPVSEGIVAEAREERVHHEEEQRHQDGGGGFNTVDTSSHAQPSTSGGDQASTSTSTSPQQQQHHQQQQQARRPARPTLRDNLQWKDEIKVCFTRSTQCCIPFAKLDWLLDYRRPEDLGGCLIIIHQLLDPFTRCESAFIRLYTNALPYKLI